MADLALYVLTGKEGIFHLTSCRQARSMVAGCLNLLWLLWRELVGMLRITVTLNLISMVKAKAAILSVKYVIQRSLNLMSSVVEMVEDALILDAEAPFAKMMCVQTAADSILPKKSMIARTQLESTMQPTHQNKSMEEELEANALAET